jgi:hypothetical protein
MYFILDPSSLVKSLMMSSVSISIMVPQNGKYLDPCSRGTFCELIVISKLVKLLAMFTEHPYSG